MHPLPCPLLMSVLPFLSVSLRITSSCVPSTLPSTSLLLCAFQVASQWPHDGFWYPQSHLRHSKGSWCPHGRAPGIPIAGSGILKATLTPQGDSGPPVGILVSPRPS